MKTVLFSLILSISFLANSHGNYQKQAITCIDGVERPYILYLPNSVKQKKDIPLLVFLHGAISNPNLKKDPLAYMKRSPFVKIAEEGNFALLFPYGQKGATWFDKVGIEMVLSEINKTVSLQNIDVNKIFLGGFSDGASGAFYAASTYASSFAGFIVLNGHVKAAVDLGESQVYIQNINSKPMFMINTKGDYTHQLKICPL